MEPQPPSSLPDVKLRRTSGMAIASMACGIASFVFILLPSVVAIFLGHRARYKIKKSNGMLLGNRMALTGLICGYGSLFFVASVTGYIVYEYKKSNRIEAEEIAEEIKRGKEIHSLVLKYEADHGKFPDALSDLVNEGYISSLNHLQPETGGNWVYFKGLTSKSWDRKYIIRSQVHKVCIYIDGTDGSRNLSFTFEPTDSPMRDHESIIE